MAIKIAGIAVITNEKQWNGGDFKPNSSDYSLGHSTDKWKDLYINGDITFDSGIIRSDASYVGFYTSPGASAQNIMTNSVYAGDSYATGWSQASGGMMNAKSGYKVGGSTVIDSSRNIENIHNIGATGDIQVYQQAIFGNSTSGDSRRVEINSGNGQWAYTRYQSPSYLWDVGSKTTDSSGALQFRPAGGDNGRMVLARNGNLTINGGLHVNGTINAGDVTGTSGKFGRSGNADNNDVILDLATERAWRFIQDGSGSSAKLTLEGYYENES